MNTQLPREFELYLPVDKRLVVQFFYVFARFEYALKEAGYVRPSRNDTAEPNWADFTNKYGRKLDRLASTEATKAIAYLKNNPPKAQTYRDHKLEWENRPQGEGENNLAYLLRLVKTVRNNLFHGGKFAKIQVEDPARDQELLGHCVNLLYACLELDDKVKGYFTDRP